MNPEVGHFVKENSYYQINQIEAFYFRNKPITQRYTERQKRQRKLLKKLKHVNAR